jgi:Cu2+-exporting ATPase
MIDEVLIRVGSYHFIAEDSGIDCQIFEEQGQHLREQGKSLVYVAKNDKLIGILALQDRVRPEAGQVLQELRNSGARKIVILSGDHKQSVQALEKELPGVDEFQAQLLPEHKTQVIRDLQAQGYRVAVIGDGINDAPAFVAADVGICMSTATGLARESAGVVLMRDNLKGLVILRKIGQRADNLLQSSFNTGVTVNTALMLAAGAGKLSPALAATAHNMTTFAILGRALWAMRG